MIVDRIQNGKAYPLGNAWQLAFEFLVSLKPDAEEKKYHVQGDDVFAMVMSCETRPPGIAVLETHRKYLLLYFLRMPTCLLSCLEIPLNISKK